MESKSSISLGKTTNFTSTLLFLSKKKFGQIRQWRLLLKLYLTRLVSLSLSISLSISLSLTFLTNQETTILCCKILSSSFCERYFSQKLNCFVDSAYLMYMECLGPFLTLQWFYIRLCSTSELWKEVQCHTIMF